MYELFVTYAIFVFIRLIYFIYVFNKNEWFASLITDDILIVGHSLIIKYKLKFTFCELLQFCELWKVNILMFYKYT